MSQTRLLTTSVDDVTGTANNDTFKGVLDSGTPANNTLTALDSIDGGAGIDTLSVLDAVGGDTVPASLVLTSIETVNVRSAGAITIDTSGAGFSSVNDVNVTQALGATDVTASSSQDVSVSGVAGDIDVAGGEDVSVTDNTADTAITVGNGAAGGDASGTITIVDNDNAGTAGTDDITVEGGTDVSVTTSADASSGDIIVGDATNGTASGDVVVNQNTTSDASAAVAVGDVTVTGGSTITINASSTNTASAGNGANVAAGTYTANAGDSTTDITVNQNHVANDFAKSTTGATKETSAVTFGALEKGEQVAISAGALTGLGTDLTFTASKNLTAEEVAQAFANLTAADTQAAGGVVANGVFTGDLDAGWTSSAASGASVTFTAATVGDQTAEITVTTRNATNAAVATNDADFDAVATDGSAGTTVAGQDVTTANGQVVVSDNATASVTTISIDGYANASSIASADALQTLNLANSDAGADLEVDTAATSLTVNVDAVTSTAANNAVVNLDSSDGTNNQAGATVTDLTLNAAGAGSAFILEASVVENLTIDAAADLDIGNASSTFGSANLKTVDVNGAGEVDLGDLTASVALNSFDASGNTGGVTATVEGDAAALTGSLEEYVLSGGNDDVTVNVNGGSAVDVKVTAGAGDDTVTLTSGIDSAGEVISGGEGTDTLVMDAADAETASSTATFEGSIEGFEKLGLGDVVAGQTDTVDLANMDDISYVIAGGSTVGQDVTITGSTTEAADIVSLVVDGVTYSTDAGTYADGTAIATNLVGKIDGNNNLSATANAGVLTITSTITNVVVGDISVSTDTNDNDSVSATTAQAEGYVLDNLANSSTVELTKHAQVTANITDADTNAADVLNLVIEDDASVDAGVVTANDVETINIAANDVFEDSSVPKDGKDNNDATHTLLVDADSAESVVVTGDDLTLDTNSTVLTSVDASAMTGGITYTADGAAAGTTVTGGQGSDDLTASGSNDVLNGGAGDDTLTGANLTQLSGGEGADTFVMNKPSNVNSYSTITDLEAGDVIDFGAATGVVFSSAALDLADTAVFQDYANEAVNQLGTDTNDAAWFQFGGNTFIVQSGGDHDATPDFQAGQDSIIQITGLVDLSTASYNQTDGTLEIA